MKLHTEISMLILAVIIAVMIYHWGSSPGTEQLRKEIEKKDSIITLYKDSFVRLKNSHK